MTPSGPPKAITCEDSFKSCTTHDAAATVVRPCTAAPRHCSGLNATTATKPQQQPATVSYRLSSSSQ